MSENWKYCPYCRTECEKEDLEIAMKALRSVVDYCKEHAEDKDFVIQYGKILKINKFYLNEILREHGCCFNDVKKEWAKAGLLIRNSQGAYFAVTTLHGVNGNYVSLIVDDLLEVDTDGNEASKPAIQ